MFVFIERLVGETLYVVTIVIPGNRSDGTQLIKLRSRGNFRRVPRDVRLES